MSKPFFSIICTTHNSTATLERAVFSVSRQPFKDIELIVIDDCSTDETLKLLKKLQQEDHRVIVIENETNIGPYLSRKKGIEKASGDYLLFLDSDDYYKENSLQSIFNKIKNKTIDFLFYNVDVLTDDSLFLIDQTKYEETVCDYDEASRVLFDQFLLKMGLYRKCVKTNLAKGAFNENDRYFMYEDGLQTIEFFKSCKTFLFLNESYYVYDKTNQNSLTNTNDKYFNGLNSFLSLLSAYYNLHLEKHQAKNGNSSMINILCSLIVAISKSTKTKKEKINKIKELRNSDSWSLIAAMKKNKNRIGRRFSMIINFLSIRCFNLILFICGVK